MRNQERGLTFIGLVLVSVVVAVLALVLVQVVPTLIEYQSVSKAAKRAAEGSTVAEVRSLFDKAAAIDDFTSIKGADLDISKDNDRVIVKFAYEREIHLAGPAWLVMRYSGSSQ